MLLQERLSEKTAIAQVIDTTDTGGAERVAIQLANGFAAMGLSSHLIVTRYLGPLSAQIDPAVHVLVLNRQHTIDLKAIRQVIAYIRKWNIGILHGHSWSSTYWCILWKRLGYLPALTIYHDHEPINPPPLSRVAKFREWLDRVVLRSVNGVIGVSHLNLARDKRLLSAYGIPIIYLPNGIDAAPYQKAARFHDGRTIIQVANVQQRKGHLHIGAIARQLNQLLDKFKWMCIGTICNQAYYEEVRQNLAQNDMLSKVSFLGKRTDVPELLAQATVGVLTSEAEGLSIALLEYMAVGLPVVVTDVGGCGKVVEEAGCGLVISSGRDAEFAEAIARLCLNPAEAGAMGKRGQLAVQEHYSAESMMKHVGNFYAQLLERTIQVNLALPISDVKREAIGATAAQVQ